MSSSFFHGKRGVSEVIGSLIIILIVSVTGAGLYTYSLNAFNSSRSSFLLQTSEREERVLERLLITTVWWNVTNDYLNVTVLNYGKIELAIDAVYIDGRQVPASTYTNGKGETVAVSSLVSVKFTSPISIIAGYTYEISAVSERGSRDVFYWKA
jgi:archaellum component FlaF (FlaF/FlaG flagellin family)